MKSATKRCGGVVLACVLLGACSQRPEPMPESSDRLGHYYFGYDIERATSTGLSQVFDDCERTYLQFYPPLRPKAQVLLATGNRRDVMRADSGYFTRPGTFSAATVIVDGKESTVTRRQNDCLPKQGSKH